MLPLIYKSKTTEILLSYFPQFLLLQKLALQIKAFRVTGSASFPVVTNIIIVGVLSEFGNEQAQHFTQYNAFKQMIFHSRIFLQTRTYLNLL